MTGWIILGLYAAGVVYATPVFARVMINDLVGEDKDAESEDRFTALFTGFLIALFWPASLTFRAAWLALRSFGPDWLRTDAEKRREVERENARLRELARKYNLPMGD